MRHVTKLIPALAATLLLAACGSSSTTSASSPAPAKSAASPTTDGAAAVVKTASNPTLGATILVDSQGLTLYHLSGEQNGKWICTSAACLQAWHPLTVSTDAAPSGSVGSLGTIKRPGGKIIQVTYKGAPLYTFVGDTKAGDAKGQGIKDVGVWTAVDASGTASSKPAAPAPASTSSGSTSTSSGSNYGY